MSGGGARAASSTPARNGQAGRAEGLHSDGAGGMAPTDGGGPRSGRGRGGRGWKGARGAARHSLRGASHPSLVASFAQHAQTEWERFAELSRTNSKRADREQPCPACGTDVPISHGGACPGSGCDFRHSRRVPSWVKTRRWLQQQCAAIAEAYNVTITLATTAVEAPHRRGGAASLLHHVAGTGAMVDFWDAERVADYDAFVKSRVGEVAVGKPLVESTDVVELRGTVSGRRAVVAPQGPSAASANGGGGSGAGAGAAPQPPAPATSSVRVVSAPQAGKFSRQGSGSSVTELVCPFPGCQERFRNVRALNQHQLSATPIEHWESLHSSGSVSPRAPRPGEWTCPANGCLAVFPTRWWRLRHQEKNNHYRTPRSNAGGSSTSTRQPRRRGSAQQSQRTTAAPAAVNGVPGGNGQAGSREPSATAGARGLTHLADAASSVPFAGAAGGTAASTAAAYPGAANPHYLAFAAARAAAGAGAQTVPGLPAPRPRPPGAAVHRPAKRSKTG